MGAVMPGSMLEHTQSDNYIKRLILFWPREKCNLWCNACHPCAQTSSVIWQHRNAPRWAWREIRRHVVQVVRGRGHSSGMEQRTKIKFCFKLQLRLWKWWDKCMGIIAYLVRRYSGGMHDSKVVWKRLEMKPGLGVHFLFVTRHSLRKWEDEYKKNVALENNKKISHHVQKYINK